MGIRPETGEDAAYLGYYQCETIAAKGCNGLLIQGNGRITSVALLAGPHPDNPIWMIE